MQTRDLFVLSQKKKRDLFVKKKGNRNHLVIPQRKHHLVLLTNVAQQKSIGTPQKKKEKKAKEHWVAVEAHTWCSHVSHHGSCGGLT